MTKYYVALSFYVEESADDLRTAKRSALAKVRCNGKVMHDLEAVGIKEPNDWREITITEEPSINESVFKAYNKWEDKK